MKQKMILIVSLVCGILAFMLTINYINSKEKEFNEMKSKLLASTRKIWVVAAAEDIPQGVKITKSDIGQIQVSEKDVPDRVVLPEDYEMIIGKKTAFPLKKNKVILWTDIEGGIQTRSASLSTMVQAGMRAISLPISGSAAVSCMVEPGDRVDILGTFTLPSSKNPAEMETVTLTLLQDVSVLAVGQITSRQMSSRQKQTPPSYNSVTVEVTPRESELLVFAQQAKGSLTLALRNPSDVSFEKDLPETNFYELEKKLPELNQFRQKNIRGKRD